MNVTGWDLASRMKLPDHCFGNRQAIGTLVWAALADTWYYSISLIALPDPVCLWKFYFWFQVPSALRLAFRVGLAAAVPTNEAEMDAAAELLPYIGEEKPGPNWHWLGVVDSLPFEFELRKGMVTGGLKLVAALNGGVNNFRGNFVFVVSELPTKVPGWPGAWPAG